MLKRIIVVIPLFVETLRRHPRSAKVEQGRTRDALCAIVAGQSEIDTLRDYKQCK